MQTITSASPFLGGALPQLPVVKSAASLTVIKPTIPTLPMINSGSSTPGTPGLAIPKNLPVSPPPVPASPFATFGQGGVNLGNSGSTTPAMPIIPATTPAALAPHVTTPSGAQVSPNTGALITPAPAAPAVPSLSSGGGQAPPGMEYGPDGQLRPIQPPPAPGAPAAPSGTPGSTSTGSTLPNGVTKNADGTYTITNSDGTTSTIGGGSDTVSGASGALKAASQLSPEELAAMQGLSNLNTSYKTAYTNTEGQPIALDFITGQQKVLADREAQLAAPLQAQQQIEETKRQANITAAQSLLGVAQQQNTPIPIPLGGTAITPSNPGNVLGTGIAGGSGASPSALMATSPTAPNGQPFDSASSFDADVQSFMNTGQLGTSGRWNTPGYAGAIQQRANQLSQQAGQGPFNLAQRQAQVQAAGSTLTQQQTLLSNTSGALQTLKDNSKLLLDGMQKDGLNGAQAPWFNEVFNAWKSLGLNPADPNSAADVAQFTNSLTTLQAEYNKLLAGSGATTEGGAGRAAEALPAGISVAGLGQLFNRIIGEGNNKVNSINTQIGTLNKQLNPYDFSGGKKSSNIGSSSSGGGSMWSW